MEDPLVRERAAEQNVHYLLKNKNEPVSDLLAAFDKYRQLCQACIFADFEHAAARKEAVLWQAHTDGKKYFSSSLKDFRKAATEQPVATRHLIKLYLHFIKESQRFYREHIHQLSTTFGGIPELEAVAHQVRSDDSGESSQSSISLELRKKVLDSCHHTLICLGDLSRYRASEKLDKNPDFGPAIGYYGLACTLRPSSGMGHHQQAVIALEQRHHLRAIYHLYRAMVVAEPHPNAVNNLKLEFDKTNAAWDRGELIQKGPPNDPEASKRTLVGWFVRMHSMCYKGEPFREYEELEREVLGRLAAEIKQRSLDSTLIRMIMVNLAAQYNAGEKFQENPIPQHQNAFLQFFRFNIKTYTALLEVFTQDLKTASLRMASTEEDADLATGLTDILRRLLPALRLYSSWLLTMTHLMEGLSTDDLLKDAIEKFWPCYAKTFDRIIEVFGAWELDDITNVTYLLEEDADIVGFKPLLNERTNSVWCDKQTRTAKSHFSDRGVQRLSADEENLARLRGIWVDGLFLANDDDFAPIRLRGSRILHRDQEDVEMKSFPMPNDALLISKAEVEPVVPPSQPKPLSYAAAAARGPTKAPSKPTVRDADTSSTSSAAQQVQLTRMVDDLVRDTDDDGNNPVTPPQQHTSRPAVVTNGDVSYSALPGSDLDFAQLPNGSHQPVQKPIGTGPGVKSTTPEWRTAANPTNGTQTKRLQTVSNVWHNSPAPMSSTSSHFPAGLPTGTLSSPARFASRGRSRVNSASSIRSRTSQNINLGVADSWSSLDSAPRANGPASGFGGALSGPEHSNLASPLLFGAGGGLWSTASKSGYRNVTPPQEQG